MPFFIPAIIAAAKYGAVAYAGYSIATSGEKEADASKSAAKSKERKNTFVRMTFSDSTPRLRAGASGKDNIILDTPALKNRFSNKDNFKKGAAYWPYFLERKGKWVKVTVYDGMDKGDPSANLEEFENYHTWKSKAKNLQTGWIYAITARQAEQDRAAASAKKREELSNKDGAQYRSKEGSAERKLETSSFGLDTFLPSDSIGLGYTLLFNFISGNPYVQDKYVKRDDPRSSAKGSLLTKTINVGGERTNILSKIGPERLQTKIVKYKEDALAHKGYVHLPLNTVMKSTTEISYGGKAMGLFEDLLTSYIRGGGKGVKDNIIAELGFKAATDTTIGQAQAAGNKFFGTNIDVAARFNAEEFQAGTSTNPRTYEQYTGSAPRTFEYKQTFHPESIEQAGKILYAINKLKYHTQARRGQTSPIRLMNPDRVVVRLIWGEVDTRELEKLKGNAGLATSFLFNLKPCVVTKIDVSYGSSEEIGTYFKGGIPAEITLALSLKEQEITYADDIMSEGIVLVDGEINLSMMDKIEEEEGSV